MTPTKETEFVRFGPSGNDVLFYEQGGKSSVQAPAWVAALGLSAYEVNFGRGIRLSDGMAAQIGAEAAKHNVQISAHAPYFINLASPDRDAIKKSYGYIHKSLKLLKIMGGERLVIHIGSQGELSREVALANCEKNLRWVISELDRDKVTGFLLCIETMGRYRAIGSYQEICKLCEHDPRIIPTLDFGHINCTIQGAFQRNPEVRFKEVMDYVECMLGREKFKKIHMHYSAVTYTEKGERKHTTLDDAKWAFPFEPLAKIIKQRGIYPTIICESQSIMAQDAAKLKKIYDKVK